MRKGVKAAFLVLMVLVVTILLAEGLVRLLGYKPIQQSPYSFVTEPADLVVMDTVLGYRFNKGEYTFKYGNGFSFRANHPETGTRWCGGLPVSAKDTLLILGCSYAYGQGVADTTSMPFLLQQANERTTIINAATPGYSTVQQFLVLKEWSKHNYVPNKVLLCYASFHNPRNVLSRAYLKNIYQGFTNSVHGNDMLQSINYPIADGKGRIIHVNPSYPLYNMCTHSAFVNLADNAYNNLESKKAMQDATLQVMQQLADWCKEHKTELYLFSYTSDEESLQVIESMKKQGVNTYVNSIPIFDKIYSLQPYDVHPNALANREVAKQISDWVQKK